MSDFMFKVKLLKDWRLLNGTSLQGYINCDYSTLVKVFGEPQGGYDDYKSDCAWDVVINGVVCTIYNYKDGKNYNGPAGLDKEYITNWHIGGKSRFCDTLVNDYVAYKMQLA